MGELTTKEIIEELRKGMPTFDSSDEECERYEKAYNMAIEMLERTKPIDEIVVNELEKMKKRINQLSLGKWYVGRLDNKSEEVASMEEINFVFDKRISELKGE